MKMDPFIFVKMKGTLPGTESEWAFLASGQPGRRATSTVAQSTLFNERPKATYFSLLHNTNLKDIILQIINSVK